MYFFDPLIKRCAACDVENVMCRKKVVLRYYLNLDINGDIAGLDPPPDDPSFNPNNLWLGDEFKGKKLNLAAFKGISES
jgi:hypothetical protein